MWGHEGSVSEMNGWFLILSDIASIWIELQSTINLNALQFWKPLKIFFSSENCVCKHATKEKYNVIHKVQNKWLLFKSVQVCLMCRLRCWKTRRGKANAKGVNEIISTFPVLWEVLWLTPPDSVEQETILDPPDLGLKPKLTKLL